MTSDPGAAGYRSYEVYQRERVGETTNLVDPRTLLDDSYLADPFTVPGVMRENYPCYRDWVANRFWITRYDDVTSVFSDDANFESRPRLRAYGSAASGVDFGDVDEIAASRVGLADAALEMTLARVIDELGPSPDLAVDFADRLATGLLTTMCGFGDQADQVLHLLAQVKAGTGWSERERVAGIEAFREARRVISSLLVDRRDAPAGDLLTALADLGASSDDVVVTLAEMDFESLPASLSNLWCLLLTHPAQLDAVKAEPRLMKFAYLESLRHSPVTVTTDRFARHETERFGRLLPEGALLQLSAAAANRDPRQFADPDQFIVGRKDLCQREPRGQYRADGLPAGITFAHGKPSRLPAEPRDVPRSRYAVTRDIAVTASHLLLERFPDIGVQPDASPSMACRRLGGPYRCWQLPTTLAAN